MLKEAKKALRVTNPIYDTEIAALLMAGANDLQIAGVVLPGTVTFTIGTDDAVADTSTLTDELIITAISIWCNMRIGNPPNYDNLLRAYESLKGQLRLSKSYTGVVTV